MNNYITGYLGGAFDLFHIGHLNIIRESKSLCDKLIVGVSVEEIISRKRKNTVIPINNRIEIVRSIKYVDSVIPQRTLDKVEIWKKLKYDILFVGDDWYDTKSWNEYEKYLKTVGVKVVYIPYTKINDISTTSLIKKIKDNF